VLAFGGRCVTSFAEAVELAERCRWHVLNGAGFSLIFGGFSRLSFEERTEKSWRSRIPIFVSIGCDGTFSATPRRDQGSTSRLEGDKVLT
jgi:hypothetical protein